MGMIGNFVGVTDAELRAVLNEPEAVTDIIYADDETALTLDIDKTWHVIHFLLSGETWGGTFPENFIQGGATIGDVDVGYGPARGYSSDEVKKIAALLTGISTSDIKARYDANAISKAEIYPDIWSDVEDGLSYLLPNYQALRSFVQSLNDQNLAMITYIA